LHSIDGHLYICRRSLLVEVRGFKPMVKHSGGTIIPERMFTRIKFISRIWLFIVFGCCLISFSFPQTTEEEEDPVEVFWGEDEEYDDEYAEDDTLGYEDYFDDEEYSEDDEYYDDEYAEDDTSEYEYEDDEYYEDDELSEEDLADYADSKGFTFSLTGTSPGYVNHQLMTYNSNVDYKVGVEFPLLLQISVLKFRIGLEYGTFSFINYLPAGGEYSGSVYNGYLSFPAGPGQVKIGGGSDGNNIGYFAETTYGFAMKNSLEIRAGVRSTTISNVVNTKNVDLGSVSWLDGIFTLGITF